ncbi:MAG: polysaccharide biosynthesis/export family protein [Deltaproteobacteria bacterium]|nr:polysaccharide biosynthesis/export family protein [Deltaproteobacteria bacterium]
MDPRAVTMIDPAALMLEKAINIMVGSNGQGWSRRRKGLTTPKTIVLSLFLIIACSCCSHRQEPPIPDMFETVASQSGSVSDDEKRVIRRPDDVARLKKLESDLKVTQQNAGVTPGYQVLENVAVPNVPEYRIGPGDIIEIVYHISYGKTRQDYLIEVQDKISISFPYHPQFSSTVMVRTDGKVTVPLLGDIEAESKTPMELAAILNQRYSRYLHNPSITVALEEFNVKIDELKKAITTASRGQSKIAPVSPDGKIAFPMIGNIQGEGYTLSQLEKIINEKYSHLVRNLNATLIFQEIHHSKFYILGEVERPGGYDMPNRMNLIDALAVAGGYKKSAYLDEVVIFRNDGLQRPMAFKTDLGLALKKGAAYVSLQIKPADIIFVPRTRIDKFNELVERIFAKGLYTILPFGSAFTINYSINSTGGATTIIP